MGNLIAGIDACRGGWFVVLGQYGHRLRLLEGRVLETFTEAASWASAASAIAVDIPIGLADKGFRECDLATREMMGRYKGRVFKTSPRPAILAPTVAERHRLHRKLTGEGLPPPAAAFAPKVAQVDTWMCEKLKWEPRVQDRVFEVHPELCFRALNGGAPVAESKHDEAGLRVRENLLRRFFVGQDLGAWVRRFLRGRPRSEVLEDDVLDAIVTCVTAGAWEESATIPRPDPPRDSCGFRMEMRVPSAEAGGRYG